MNVHVQIIRKKKEIMVISVCSVLYCVSKHNINRINSYSNRYKSKEKFGNMLNSSAIQLLQIQQCLIRARFFSEFHSRKIRVRIIQMCVIYTNHYGTFSFFFFFYLPWCSSPAKDVFNLFASTCLFALTTNAVSHSKVTSKL